MYRLCDDTGYFYWDSTKDNTGLMPVTTPEFPRGMPVITDRLSVSRYHGRVRPTQEAIDRAKIWRQAHREAYGPLRHAFNKAWPKKAAAPDAAHMAAFWLACAAAGWSLELKPCPAFAVR